MQVIDAINLLISLTQATSVIAPILKTAQEQGRTQLTDAEWQQITGTDDSAMSQLTADIAKAQAAGR